MRTIALSAAVLLAAALPAQQASFTPFGQGCNVQRPIPAIGNRGLPRIGTTFVVTYSGPNAIQPGIGLTEQPTLLIGAARVDLPVPRIRVTQPPNCTLYPWPNVVVPMPPAAGNMSYETDLRVPVPNSRALLGADVFFQWMTPHIQCTFVGCDLIWIMFSDGARATIGV